MRRTSLVAVRSAGWAPRTMASTSHHNIINRRLIPLFNKLAWKKPNRFGWHALRHFAISTWNEAKFSLKAVQGFAGHASAQMTLDRYGHLFKDDDHKRGAGPRQSVPRRVRGGRS